MSRAASEIRLCHEQIRVRGIVQGVGFRPTVWRLATESGLLGHTLNDGDGVLIDAWAPADSLSNFVARLAAESPSLARIDAIERNAVDSGAVPESFEIVTSFGGEVRTAVVADAAACDKCVEETLDPFNRRYRYPFTNCTDCGPRMSIVHNIPYDRDNTSMSTFRMCAECEQEYNDPANRRFHAQPNACHACGPKARLVRTDGHALFLDALTQLDDVDAAGSLIQKGKVVAIKGIGGFHLACDATNTDAVHELRQRKRRFAKPFALMTADVDIIREYCHVTDEDAALLRSPAAPIVILARRSDAKLPDGIAPGQRTLGVMLPYTPLHHLLLRRMRRPIVLTSGNVSDEPQCIDNADALKRLQPLCDYLLVHDRDIVNRVDDSVVRVVSGDVRVMRRGRGYSPASIPLPDGFQDCGELLALGADLKNTFCLVQKGNAILSQHIGDLHDAPTYDDYEKNLQLYGQLFEHAPAQLVADFHPEYMSTKLACAWVERGGKGLTRVQHHHAHIAACLGDNAWPLDRGAVLGVVLDGLGISESGEFWGGEFLLADYHRFDRLGTFKPVALPGNAQAMYEPWRNTYAHIVAQMGWPAFKINFGELELCRFLESKPLAALESMIKSGTNAPHASSCGRLFDAVAAAAGICRDEASYEGQAAIELEAAVDERCLNDEPDHLAYPMTLPRLYGKGIPYIEPLAMWNALLGDLILKTPVGVISARFHKGLAKAIVHAVRVLSTRDGQRFVNDIALSGGVFQNKVLFEQVAQRLENEQFNVISHRRIPANDSGIAFGQALVAAARTSQERETSACA